MAQLVVSAVGAAVGFVVGGPAGAAYGWTIGSAVGAYAFAEDQTVEGPRLKDLKITGTDYGDTIPWVAGSPRIAGQIIWASPRRETRHEEEVGGKGGGGGATQVTYTYDCDLLILLTENPRFGVSRIWSNNELVWRAGTGAQKSGVWSRLILYRGLENQLPDPTYEAAVGVGNAPAYRGRSTVMIEGLQLGGSGTIPNLTFELGAVSDRLVPVMLHDFSGYYDQGWGPFGDRNPHPSEPLRSTPINTFLPMADVGDTTEISKTIAVIPEFPCIVSIYHDNTCELSINGDAVYPHQMSSWVSEYVFTPHTKSVRVDLKVTDTTPLAPTNYRYAAFRFIQMRPEYDAAENSPVSLAVLCAELARRAGYSDSEINALPLWSIEKPVRALALSQVSSTRSALEVLQKCWHFECAATEKLSLRPRALAPIARIHFEHLGFAQQSGGLDDPLTMRIGNDLEMPAQIALTYPNMAGDYNADSQFSDRLISGQQSTQTMQVPVGMLPAEAKGVVDALLMDAVAGLQSTTLSVPLKYAFVEPGDVVEAVDRDGRIYRLRVQTRKDQGVWLELECTLDDVGALESAAITDEGYITVQDPTSVPDTILHALDVPLLRDADDQPGFYLAVAPDSINVATDQWKGANVASSWDDVDYASLLSVLEAATVGEALTVLPAWSGAPVFDEASVLQVEMLGQLSSTSRAAMLLDEAVNALLVGDEVVRFRNAELVDADEDRGRYTYQLTGFIRGFRGTEWTMGGHVVGERCVLLNRGVRRVNTQLNELQVQRWLKATTVGKYITDVQPQAFTNTGRALKPFAPVGLRALPEAGVGVHLSWQRRTRLSYRYGGVSPSVPLGEASERYRVQVFAGDALLRTEIVTQPSYDYTTTLAATDGLNAGDPVRFEVCQLSESVGAGYTTTKEGFAA
ncbi:phage tail protein [Comamonas aquatica]|uniref:Phage tail protein n=1 Tax=Comamonas aquatica TaxID=225991 RepID=A0AA43ATY3_9BURK|nr:phage tail protein [Comamonas aquatica]MDH1429092.1 phage tail protein [Comamonas aquatica]MDH1604969.1 phage tail protein [Comamonas aquatica]MDH1615993.1 phage tail protein [Comamonas aquatica]MDH2004858.1 phage tail protein [Comamonas aquatica]